jgi:hypothetical protein
MDIIKEFLIFDDSAENYNLKGGAAIAKVASSPEVQDKVTDAGSNNTSGDKESNNSNNKKDLEKVQDVSLFGDFGDSIMETVRDTYKKFKNFILGYFIIPIMFGSFAPALPFFVVMAAMFAILNYLMRFFRKL